MYLLVLIQLFYPEFVWFVFALTVTKILIIFQQEKKYEIKGQIKGGSLTYEKQISIKKKIPWQIFLDAVEVRHHLNYPSQHSTNHHHQNCSSKGQNLPLEALSKLIPH